MRVLVKLILPVFLFVSFAAKHPFYLGVTEMKYNANEKSIETTIKLFSNDLEDALKKIYKTKVDLINGKDKASIHTILEDYVKNHFKLKLDGKSATFELIGFEHESEAVWIYVEYKNCPLPKKLEIENTLLYEYLKSQTNIIQVDINGNKKSSKVSNPDKNLLFEY